MHIAMICHEFTSRLNTSLEFADRLRAAGHRVTYVSHADVGDAVALHGHGFHRLSSTPADPPRLGRPSIRRMIPWTLESLRLRKATAGDVEIERCLSEIGPDCLVIDIEMHYATIAATNLGLPVVLYMNWFSIFRQPDIPPMSSGLIPSGTGSDRNSIRRAWRRVTVDAWIGRIRRKLGRAMIGDHLRPISYATYHYADLKEVARAREVSLHQRADRHQWLIPLMFMDVPILSFTAREMELPSVPHPNMRYVGPMVPDRRMESFTDELSEWNRYRAEIRANRVSGPIVYCSLGSFVTDVRFIRKVVDVFRHRRDWNLVVGLGHKATRTSLGPVPENVLLLDWAPQLEVLSVADAAITHGGSSSVHECIVNAVPLLVYPPENEPLDRAGNAARVQFHGLGLRGRRASDEPSDIEHHLDRLLTDPSFIERLTDMQRIFEQYRSSDTAVEVLEAEYQLALTEPESRRQP